MPIKSSCLTLTIFLLIICPTLSRVCQTQKQCDIHWSSIQMGTSSYTICQQGSSISSISNALCTLQLSDTSTPATVNKYLKNHEGYVFGNGIVWGKLQGLGLQHLGMEQSKLILGHVKEGKIAIGHIANTTSGNEWVLIFYQNNTLYIQNSAPTDRIILIGDLDYGMILKKVQKFNKMNKLKINGWFHRVFQGIKGDFKNVDIQEMIDLY